MENFIEYTNSEDVAILLIVLEELEVEHKATSYCQRGNAIARIDITPKGDNPVKFGYDLAEFFESRKKYIIDDHQKFRPEDFKWFKDNWFENVKKYQKLYTKKIAEVEPLFEIECPKFEEVELPNGEKAKIEYETDLIMDEEDFKKMMEGEK